MESENGIAGEYFENFVQERLRNMEAGSNTEDAAGSQNSETRDNNVDRLVNTIQALVSQNTEMLRMLQLNNSQQAGNDVQNFNIMPDLSKTIEQFDGEKGPANAKLWLQQLENTALLHHWPDAFTYQTAQNNLRGAATYWFKSRCSKLTDWNSFKEAFKKTFLFERSKTECWQRMQSRMQLPKENVSVYFHSKVSLCEELNLDFSETKEQVVIGLYSKDLSNFIMSKCHNDEDDLYQDIVNYERISNARRGKITERKDTEKNKNTKARERTEDIVPNQGASQIRSSSDREVSSAVRCYNCNQIGHILAKCTRPTRPRGSCYGCGSMDHLRRNCPQMQPSTNGPSASNSEERSVALFVNNVNPSAYTIPIYLEAYNYKRCLNCIIDSGSPISLIKKSEVDGLVLNSEDTSSCSFEGINKSKLEILGSIVFKVVVVDVTIDLHMFVVHDNAIPYKCLLGRNFMCNPSLKIHFVGDNISIETINHESNVFQNVSNEILNVHYVDTQELPELQINSKIAPIEQLQVHDLFVKYYVEPVRPSVPDTEFHMKIVVDKNHMPFYFKPRRLSFKEKEAVKQILEDLLQDGIIQKSNSEYSSPIVLVHKKNRVGEYRMCIDFRQLNQITVRDNYPLPLIEDQLDQLRDKKYFTNLDLKSAFHHVSLEPSSIKYTSFVTPTGQYEYLKMPFGLKNSPSVFMRYINTIFRDLLDQNKIMIYIDDIVIATKTIDENLEILKNVFQLLVNNKLTLRIDKCSFLNTEITYLGYIIKNSQIMPSNGHVEAINNYPVPRNVKELQSFIGLASYFRKFVQNFSIIAKPLYDLTKKNATFNFGSEQADAFNKIKNCLISQPVLSIYSPEAETQLHCDASSLGYAGILLQKQSDSKFHPVCYYSQRTTETESKLHSFELEMLAIINSLNRFRVYLQGIRFKIVTDCNSLNLALKKKDINPKIMRWSLILQNYDYSLEHRDSTRMKHADALSRCHNNILVLQENTFETNLSIKQGQDSEISEIRKQLEVNDSKMFELRNGLVYRKDKNCLLFYVPKTMQSNVIRVCHDEIGHVGLDKTIEVIRRSYWFPNMRENVKEYISNCLKCIVYNPNSGKQEGFLHNIPKGDVPFDTIHVDHCGPLERSKKYNKFIFVVVDGFTKFTKVYPCKSTNSNEAIKYLKQYFYAYSKPRRVISDRGTAFTSKLFENFLTDNDISHVLIATGVPRANGQVERFNKNVIQIMSKLTKSADQWDDTLFDVEYAINNTVNKSIGDTPSKLLFGIHQTGKVNDNLKEFLDDSVGQRFDRNIELVRKKACNNIGKSQEYNKKYYDKKHKVAFQYKPGDYVVITNVDVTPGINKKLIPKFKGPYTVKRVLPNDRYVITDVDGFQLTQKPFEGIFDASHMKLWTKPE